MSRLGRLDIWVVSHLATNIGTLRHGPWLCSSVTTNSLLDPSTTSTLFTLFYLVYLIWYYYLSVKFVLLIVQQKIENKLNLFFKKTSSVGRLVYSWEDYMTTKEKCEFYRRLTLLYFRFLFKRHLNPLKFLDFKSFQ